MQRCNVSGDSSECACANSSNFRLSHAISKITYSLEPSKDLPRDVRASHLLRCGATAVAVHAYHSEVGTWPADLSTLSKWLDRPIPEDLFAAATMTYELGDPPKLISVGPDCILGTKDDLQFIRTPEVATGTIE